MIDVCEDQCAELKDWFLENHMLVLYQVNQLIDETVVDQFVPEATPSSRVSKVIEPYLWWDLSQNTTGQLRANSVKIRPNMLRP